MLSEVDIKDYKEMKFEQPPSCLDSAYERDAIVKGVMDMVKAVFPENKMVYYVYYKK